MTKIDKIRTCVLSRIKPKEPEKRKLQALAESIISRINTIGKTEGFAIKAILVGSSARGTWLSGERDLDIFIMFPPEVEREHLEEKGLHIARKIAQESQIYEERYAEHPYINAIFDGFEVDLVPAFGVESAAVIKSAVDRTPFHNSYVLSRIKGLEDEVLLLKQFMKGGGVYGSELRTHGFSGYLAELLVIHYGSFMAVIEAACTWKPGATIDIENHGNVTHKDALVMIDPTDPARNVAAALSLDNMCIFIDRSCEYLKKPDETFFWERVPESLNDDAFRDIMDKRGTSLLAIEFEPPDMVEDVLYPQLHKLEGSVQELLERFDFHVYNSGVWADGKAIVLFELESAKLPQVKKHAGPQAGSGKHAEAFKSKYNDSNTFSNVYIRNGKYMIEIPRKFTRAKDLLESEITKCGIGKHVALSIKKEYHVLEDDEILNIKDEDFRKFLRRFFEK
ncbi:MAG: CCA tRNA nucleotidyltransferase [Candidatus Methanoperedens sp.]|nr:CCA tRNA nucleotidyltransferase [Candidatus Methanoperedens sp.]